MAAYVPKQGDIIAITFDPQSGHEQKGRRPALVVSKDLFNRSTGLAIVCPITNTDRGFPFHVPLPKDSKLTGFIMVEQVKSVDFRARLAKRIERGHDDLLSEVLSILDACIYQQGNLQKAETHEQIEVDYIFFFLYSIAEDESWVQWEELARKYPNDPDIQHLHALRIGLCVKKIEQGSIRRNLAIDIFDQAYDYVMEKALKEQKKHGPIPGGLQDS